MRHPRRTVPAPRFVLIVDDAAAPLYILHVGDGQVFSAACPPAAQWQRLWTWLEWDGTLRPPIDHGDAMARAHAVSSFLAACLPQPANRAIAVGMVAGSVDRPRIQLWVDEALRQWWPLVQIGFPLDD